jgi:hypothetical protein
LLKVYEHPEKFLPLKIIVELINSFRRMEILLMTGMSSTLITKKKE